LATESGVFDWRSAARAFTAFFVSVFGTYRRFIIWEEGRQKFQKAAFIESQPQRFQKVRHTHTHTHTHTHIHKSLSRYHYFRSLAAPFQMRMKLTTVVVLS
jgi:hypothetical protein